MIPSSILLSNARGHAKTLSLQASYAFSVLVFSPTSWVRVGRHADRDFGARPSIQRELSQSRVGGNGVFGTMGDRRP